MKNIQRLPFTNGEINPDTGESEYTTFDLYPTEDFLEKYIEDFGFEDGYVTLANGDDISIEDKSPRNYLGYQSERERHIKPELDDNYIDTFIVKIIDLTPPEVIKIINHRYGDEFFISKCEKYIAFWHD